MSSQRKNILVLGGGAAGILTAHHILKHVVPDLPSKEDYQVILVNPSIETFWRPAAPRALISDDILDQSKLFVNVAKQFEPYTTGSFRFVHGTATELLHARRAVKIELVAGGTKDIDFHALVIATGGSTSSPMLALNRDTAFLRASWEAFRKELPNANSIAIVGGGPTGIEVAGELGEHLNGRPGWFSSRPKTPSVAITVVTANSQILPHLRPSIANEAEMLLSQVGVTVIKNLRVTSVSPESAGTDNVATKTTLTLDNGETLEADLYIPATGLHFNTGFIDGSLLGLDGRVSVNPTSLRVEKAGERIYAIGDAAAAARPAIHNILEGVTVLCKNMSTDLLLAAGVDKSTLPADASFEENTTETQLVPIGKSKGVGAMKGFQLPSFLVWLIKGRDYWLWVTKGIWDGKNASH